MGNFAGLWWLAVIMAVAGNLIDAVAYLLEKKSHIRIQENLKDEENLKDNIDVSSSVSHNTQQQQQIDGDAESVSYLRSCRWWAGFGTHILGASLFSLSLGLGDQAMLSPLQSITIVFNTILSWKFLNEKLNKMQLIGTGLIIIGCAGVIASGPKSKNEENFKTNDLQKLFQNTAFLIFSVIITLIAFADYIILKFFKNRVLNKKKFLLLSFVGSAAFYGSWNILLTKCFVEILASSTETHAIASDNWSHWLTYIILCGIVITTIVLEYWRQESLKNFPANYVGSMYTILVIVGGICFAAMYFNEFSGLDIGYTIGFCVAVFISFVGVGLLTFGDQYIDLKNTTGIDLNNKLYNEMHKEITDIQLDFDDNLIQDDDNDDQTNVIVDQTR